MINEKMLGTLFEGLGGNFLLVISNIFSPVELVNVICHIAVTSGTLILMYKQFKKQNKK